jgi:phosphomannomutase
MVEVLKEKFADLGLTYSIGGQISFDVFPQVWLPVGGWVLGHTRHQAGSGGGGRRVCSLHPQS